jgi:ribosomal protein S18 acetylase RimI-like enzyme
MRKMDGQSHIPITIRSFQACDSPACQRLYVEGMIGGKIAENDTAWDLEDIKNAYMKPGNHFWVAEHEGQIVGMIGVQHHDEGVGEIRRLRVHQDLRRRGIGSALLETAIKFCQDNQYLKIALDTFMDRDPAIKLFEKFRFRHSRTRDVAGKQLMDFYLDLYQGDKK